MGVTSETDAFNVTMLPARHAAPKDVARNGLV